MNELSVVDRSAVCGVAQYHLIDTAGNEIAPVNAFLDAMSVRGLSRQTVRTYAYALLSVWKWMRNKSLSLGELTETQLADYIRYLHEDVARQKPPAPRSINLHLVIVRSLYRFEMGCELPRAVRTPLEPQPLFLRPTRVGTCATRRIGRPSLRVKVPRRLVVPLKREEVLHFFESFRTYRDLAIAGLMLFSGLRSREVLLLRGNDLNLLEDELRVYGKGNKDRVLPLTPYVRRTISSYVEIERPQSHYESLFLNLKGRARGYPMTPAGLREIFRYHRKRSGVQHANPHRFRHTFASDMAREGMPLPVLMRLMGHTSIDMTMRYANLSAEDVREQFECAVRRIAQEWPDGLPRSP
jgi:site-specific recombinase XerD